MNNTVEKISKLIPLFSVTILLSSILKNYLYFSKFSININEYIDLSEFPLLFINDLIFYIIFILSFLVYLPFVYVRKFVRKKYGKENFTFNYSKKVTKIALPALIIIIILNCFKTSPLDIKLFTIQSYLITFFAVLLLHLDKDVQFSKKYCIIVSISMIFVFSIFNAFSEIHKVENGKVKYIVTFDTKERTIMSDSINYIYLGKTRNYIYMFDNNKKETIVYKFDEVQNFRIKIYS